MPGGYAVVPGRYAVRFWGVRYFFLDGTLFVARAQEQFSGGYAIRFHGRYAIRARRVL